jgi:hypothetical protein
MEGSIYEEQSRVPGSALQSGSMAPDNSEKRMRRTIAVLSMFMLASALWVSQANAYGGGGFYGSGCSAGLTRCDQASVRGRTLGRHQNAFHCHENYPQY